MADLIIPHTFIPGTGAKASEVNANFNAVAAWANGGIDATSFVTNFTTGISFNVFDGNVISIQNNGDNTAFKILQRQPLAVDEYCFLIDDNQTESASGAAQFMMKLEDSSTIPAIHVTHGGVDSFKLTLRSLKIPVSTTVQRNAITSPDAGTLLYNSTTQQLNEKRNGGWAPVGCPVGTVIMYAGASAPEGWLICNGDTVPTGSGTLQGVTADFSALYAVVSSVAAWSGKLPDLRGMFIRGAGTHGSAIDGFTPTGTLGTEQGDATAVNGLATVINGNHRHGLLRSGSNIAESGGEIGQEFNGFDEPEIYQTKYAGSHTHGLTGDTETRPANVALTYIIKY